VLYTPLALEDVLAGYEEEPELMEINYYGKILIVELVSPVHGKLVRLISSEAGDYINEKWQPGSIINLAELL